ncbi:MAG: right-handed parallel beta-helix repeat-containing protein [Phaeodactylibacter sp.]|uniref:right-handed parallel beta-helix repeat-containing protein n=1 Tax=Phaeodactylibacter sp. TaxID=1940289 RepID=UPI0032EE79CC
MKVIRYNGLVFLLFALTLWSCSTAPKATRLQSGLIITQSTDFQSDTLFISSETLSRPVLIIEGEGLTVDFGGALLIGSKTDTLPNTFTGLAVLVRNSKNVTLRNLNARGYKVALMAENTDSLIIEDCDFSYNYRQRMKSTPQAEDLSDWLYHHHNEDDEWLRYGAAVYLKNCDAATVRRLRVTGGQNGLMMTHCNQGAFYNNTIQFNSGIGIGLYRSSYNQVMHNRLDWNVRGFSYGVYSRGQDSAGILCYEQSSNNTFAYNSATHSGDGFFLWAGQHTMDTGEGGCNDNIIFGNDFSHAPTNGIEVTFSRNIIAANRLHECRYGIWGGYSYESLMSANDLRNCDFGIAIEHGHGNTIQYNIFDSCAVGVKLWERATQPEDWVYTQQREVDSRDYTLQHNLFYKTGIPLSVSGTSNMAVNDDNQFYAFEKLLEVEQPNDALVLVKNRIGRGALGDASAFASDNPTADLPAPAVRRNWRTTSRGLAPVQKIQPAPLPDAGDAMLPEGHLRGRKYILVTEWGPYDFRRPIAWLRAQNEETMTFLLLGPQGNWRLSGGEGFTRVTPKTGTFPATVTARVDPDAERQALQFEFVGEAVTTAFGVFKKRGAAVSFQWDN